MASGAAAIAYTFQALAKAGEHIAASKTIHHPSLPGEPGHELYKKYLPHGGGLIFTFEIKGDAKTAQAFIDNLSIFSYWPM